MTARRRSPRPRSSTIGCFRSMMSMASGCRGCYRSWHRILRSRKPRLRALPRGRGRRSQPHQDQEPANEWNL
jgi:hypothetical protein